LLLFTYLAQATTWLLKHDSIRGTHKDSLLKYPISHSSDDVDTWVFKCCLNEKEVVAIISHMRFQNLSKKELVLILSFLYQCCTCVLEKFKH